MKFIAALLLLVAVVQAANLLHADSPTVIPGSYMVILKDGSGVAERDAHIATLKATITAAGDSSVIVSIYRATLVGFSAKLSKEMLAIELAHPDVKYVEANQVVSIANIATDPAAVWGLARISVNTTWSSSLGTGPYTFPVPGGNGVQAYVIDTGILTTHTDFGGRAIFGFSSIDEGSDQDLNGHGTHCAGTIGGTKFGVAKNVTLIAVKVLSASGSGSTSGVIDGVEWVTIQYLENHLPSVASMSLGGSASATMDAAVVASIQAGVVYSIAAGNSNQNACNYSPARVPAAITVGATTFTDAKASYSNFGTCVDIFAPGSTITSDWIGSSNTANNTISGTSMACPHVTGVLALKLGVAPDSTPAQLDTWIKSVATLNKVVSPGTGSPNALLYSPAAQLQQ